MSITGRLVYTVRSSDRPVGLTGLSDWSDRPRPVGRPITL